MIRKQIGYGYIEPEHAAQLNRFFRDSFNFYLNFHRPSAQPEVIVAANEIETEAIKTGYSSLHKNIDIATCPSNSRT